MFKRERVKQNKARVSVLSLSVFNLFLSLKILHLKVLENTHKMPSTRLHHTNWKFESIKSNLADQIATKIAAWKLATSSDLCISNTKQIGLQNIRNVRINNINNIIGM